ncbi:Nucleolar protein fibrillarin NOP77 (RRM superfamily) [Ceraceosorus bombacis]|uniref:Nucleolar protein fibrillarin NOP77 (RRM superfamily) n=1 Tax=Ceraceosorus bombacis TaxID=401625 RepID=A0A0N7LAE9_9BASI|nr:Nucleolar protein fibrillarin NOP77 (RRM superfamily) [Ceraceosorus bombacis]
MPGKRYFDESAGDASTSTGTSTSASMAAAAAEVSALEAASSNPASASHQASATRARATLFVSRLPFSATSTDLSTFFSDVGPLRRAFVVTDKQKGSSKGVGYVTFADAKDAQRALEEMQGKTLDGGKGSKSRKIEIVWADEKPTLKERKMGKQSSSAAAAAAAAVVEDGKTDDAAVTVAQDATDQTFERPASKKRKVSAENGATLASEADATRTVIISGLSACDSTCSDKTLYKRCRKIGPVERVVYPAVDPLALSAQTGEVKEVQASADVAHAIFATPNHAALAVEKLDSHVFKGAPLSVVLKKKAEAAARLEAHMKPETKLKRQALMDRLLSAARVEAKAVGRALTFQEKMGHVGKESRLILRNLPFDIRVEDLRATFAAFGPIYGIDLPQLVVEPKIAGGDEGEADAKMEVDGEKDEAAEVPKKTRGRGFGFVWMVHRRDAEKALSGINGKSLQRGLAEKAQLKAATGKREREAAKAALEQTSAEAQAERVVAVDWALERSEWEARAEETDVETDAENEQDGESEKDGEEETDEGDSDLEPIPLDEEDDESDTSSSQGEEEEDSQHAEGEAAGKPTLPSPDQGCTLFLRNLPYQATEDELKDLFRHFGPLRYARIVMDKATQRSRGTAFVCFWQTESADAALRRAQLVETESGTGQQGRAPQAAGAKNPFSAPSVLTADASAPLTASLSLHGRVLSVVSAVAREEATSLEASARAARERSDKRNTHLMREGVPFPNSELSRLMSESEREKRLNNFGIRKAQLGANPALYISKTRLSVRQLPLYVSDRTLKRLALHAVRSFDQEVKEGKRPDLTREEKEDKTLSAAIVGADGKIQTRRGERLTAVVQTKVIRQMDRLDPITGKGRSRGYGFVEMRSLVDALKAVRWINATKVSQLLHEWLVGELEDLVKLLNKTGEKDADKSDASKTERETRIRRVKQRMQELKDGKGAKAERGGLILAEFAVENSAVTKKRRERNESAKNKDGDRKRKERSTDDERDTISSDRRGASSRGRGRGGGAGAGASRADFSAAARRGKMEEKAKRWPRFDQSTRKNFVGAADKSAAAESANRAPLSGASKEGKSWVGGAIGKARALRKRKRGAA